MTVVGDVAKAILIFFCGYFLLIAFGQLASGQLAIAVTMFVSFAAVFSIFLFGYMHDRRHN